MRHFWVTEGVEGVCARPGVREAGAGVREAWCARGWGRGVRGLVCARPGVREAVVACGSREARCQACLANGTRLYVARVTNYGEIAGTLVSSCTVCGERLAQQAIARAYTTQTKDAYERTEKRRTW